MPPVRRSREVAGTTHFYAARTGPCFFGPKPDPWRLVSSCHLPARGPKAAISTATPPSAAARDYGSNWSARRQRRHLLQSCKTPKCASSATAKSPEPVSASVAELLTGQRDRELVSVKARLLAHAATGSGPRARRRSPCKVGIRSSKRPSPREQPTGSLRYGRTATWKSPVFASSNRASCHRLARCACGFAIQPTCG